MAGNLLNIGKSGLFAAQAGLSTTGHNIANANVPGYTRQVVIQQNVQGQDFGAGFIGRGTEVVTVARHSSEFLNGQVRTAQAARSELKAFEAQVTQIDNLLADSTSGLSPALLDFFRGVQDLASNPASGPSRQALLSSADALVARFHGINERLDEIREGVNTQIATNVTLINSYSQRIAQLNAQISSYSSDPQRQPNDLLDQRDQLVLELNKHVKANVIAGDNNMVTVSIGSGQPLVVGQKSFSLAVTKSTTDIARSQVGYVTPAGVAVLGEEMLTGGELGGLFAFRAQSLDRAQNSLGRIAISIAREFNNQHKLGQDAAGALGGDFFREAQPFVAASTNNVGSLSVGATISDTRALTQSDYMVRFDGTNYSVTRLSDNTRTVISPYPQTGAQTIDGIDFSLAGSAVLGDSFIVRPTVLGAERFSLLVTDRNKIAAAAPVATNAPLTNSGSGKIDPGSVDAAYLAAPLAGPVTLAYDSASGSYSGFPAGQPVTVTSGGASTTYAAGAPVPYTADARYSFGGISVVLSGAPADGDTFTVRPNTSGVGDNRNMRLLGQLQTTNLLDGGGTTFQGAYAELVSYIGNKTREVQVTAQASESVLTQATETQQDLSGVNLDEEATNLLKYQQAYQASGKVMQIASTLFDTLLSLGGR